MNIIFWFIISLFSVIHAEPIYDIFGSSSALDENMSRFLDEWRAQTLKPIREGLYSGIHVNADPTHKSVALTFDDGPDQNNTPKVLDVLHEHGIKAAFFMVADAMDESNATVVKRAYDEGHLVLNHTYSHPHLTAIDNDDIRRQVDDASRRIEQICGRYPLLMRPPYGSIDYRVMNVLNAQGYVTILWSLDSLDWAIRDKDAIRTNVLEHIRNGDIILMHSGPSNSATPEALGEIISALRNQGFTFERLDTLLGIRAYR